MHVDRQACRSTDGTGLRCRLSRFGPRRRLVLDLAHECAPHRDHRRARPPSGCGSRHGLRRRSPHPRRGHVRDPTSQPTVWASRRPEIVSGCASSSGRWPTTTGCPSRGTSSTRRSPPRGSRRSAEPRRGDRGLLSVPGEAFPLNAPTVPTSSASTSTGTASSSTRRAGSPAACSTSTTTSTAPSTSTASTTDSPRRPARPSSATAGASPGNSWHPGVDRDPFATTRTTARPRRRAHRLIARHRRERQDHLRRVDRGA